MGLVWDACRSAVRSVVRPLGFDVVRYQSTDDHIEAIRAATGSRTVRTILDVGANIGQTAFEFQRRFPRATIHSLEPFAEAFAELERRSGETRSIVPHRIALGECDRPAVLYVNTESVTNSLLPSAPGAEERQPQGAGEPLGAVEVQVRRLDSFCRDLAIERIDILKIDTQGYECQVLEGAGTMLSPATIGVVYLEVLFVPLYQHQSSFQDVHGFLVGRGYKLYDLFQKVRDLPRGLRWANALYVPAD